VFCIFPEALLINAQHRAASPLVACETRPAGDLIPIRERALHYAVDVLVQEVARLRELRCGIGHKPLILRAVAVALFDRQARIARFLARRLRHGKRDVRAGEREQFAGLADRRVAEIPAGIGRERNGHVWKSNPRELVAVAIDLRD